jgi:DNA-binding beta-propeller fold protein YncE
MNKHLALNSFHMKVHLLIAGLVIAGFMVQAQEHSLVKVWETDTLLKVPESVLPDPAGKFLYVSNVDGQPWEKDGKGSIGKVGLDGKIIAVDWVSGLQAPKGMGLYKNKLYVADVDRVVIIDVKQAAIIETITIEGSLNLNDVTIDKTGVLYVSDSKGKKIYRIEKSRPTVWLDSLKGPNGVLVHDDRLYIANAGGLYKVEKNKSLAQLAGGMDGGATDGLTHVSGKDFIVSIWQGGIWYVKGDGTKEKLLETREQKMNTADLYYDPKNRRLYVPTFFKNKIVAFELK